MRPRKIVVDGEEFRWKADRLRDTSLAKTYCRKTIRVRVWAGGGSVLTATLHCKKEEYWHDGTHCGDDCDRCECYAHRAALTPRDVEKCIRAALAEGWSSGCRRRGFALEKVPDDLGDYGPLLVPKVDEKFELVRSVMER
jgi:hypothetical protein